LIGVSILKSRSQKTKVETTPLRYQQKRDKGDIFFHLSSLVDVDFDSLHEGQQVEYEEGNGPKGPCAENVRPVG